ncbi:MAG: hypothetical protein CBB93_009100 [Oceanospirillales bacterium TMED33]|nr:hypothetical protein [Gammaproteobacteria bacterium]RPG19190.1 MAG: hypothetical protein CBB93_009100 [Oceanospirillales bacterium TMED33]|tara:strand:- start:1280 stop:1633 length:354 start_codon:yes stop_codon:yes gene_type:complete
MIYGTNEVFPPAVASQPLLEAAATPKLANSMPSLRQTFLGIEGIPQTFNSKNNMNELSRPVFSPRLSPSTVSTERALEARVMLGPEFRHNVLATRIERTSNLLSEAPRFSKLIDILA